MPWIIRGALYGVFAFVVFGLVFFFRRFPLNTSHAISKATLQYLTIHNPWCWATLVLMLCTGCVYARWLAE